MHDGAMGRHQSISFEGDTALGAQNPRAVDIVGEMSVHIPVLANGSSSPWVVPRPEERTWDSALEV